MDVAEVFQVYASHNGTRAQVVYAHSRIQLVWFFIAILLPEVWTSVLSSKA